MMHLQNALARLRQSGTASQYLIVAEVQHEVQRLADSYSRVERTLKETQMAVYEFLESLAASDNTKISMYTQHKIIALRNALNRSGHSVPPLTSAAPSKPPKDPDGSPHRVMEGYDRKKYTAKQWEWCVRYENATGFDPMMGDFEAGIKTFCEAALFSCAWYEDHSSDAHRIVTRDIPGHLS